MAGAMSRVVVAKTENRGDGVRNALRALAVNPAKGKDVLIKPNFNTSHPTPASTHNDTLEALVQELWAMGAASISLGERSWPVTREVMEQKNVLPLLEKLQVRVIDFDDLKEEDWIEFTPKDSHWPNGFRIARPILESECLVSTGCIKTHQFGGVFTLSLKLHVGVVPTDRQGFMYMIELHGSRHQRRMIAEINAPFSPKLIVMDGVDVFVGGGPARGKLAKGNLFLAATDRVAMDATGVAFLKLLGSNRVIMESKIFDQEQIARAVELGLGASSPDEIELLPADEQSRGLRDQIFEVLNQG